MSSKNPKNKALLSTILIAIIVLVVLLLLKSCHREDENLQIATIYYNNGYQKAFKLEMKPYEKRVLEVPIKEGYVFDSWVVESGDATIEDNVFTMGVEQSKIGVIWKLQNYTITYNLNGGVLTDKVDNYNVETDAFSIGKPTKDNYKFVGWTGSNGSKPELDVKIKKGTSGDKKYTANYELIDYNISYNLNGGVVRGSLVKTYNYESDTFSLENPTKDNYVFIGWTGTGLNGNNKYVSINKGSSGNRVYTANFKPIEYTIVYNLNDGIEGENTIHSYNVETNTFDLVEPTREGYTFSGWYDNSELTGTSIKKIAKGTHGNREYYAKWDIVTYSVNYNLGGGSQLGTPVTEYTIETDDFSLINPSKNYYTFMGWTGSNGNSPETSVTVSKGSSRNKTYTANYEPIEYTITYNLNGGIEGEDTLHSYNVETNTFDLVEPTREGYTFSGWYDNSEFTGTDIKKITKGMHGDKEYYAKWDTITYTVTYNSNGGILSNNVINSYTIESETFDLVSPSKVGYTFGGWYDNSELNGDVVTKIETGSIGNKEYYAKWDVITYTVTYNLNGGTEGEDTIHSYNVETNTFDLVSPSKVGYTFGGWYDNSELNGDAVTKIETGSIGNKEYYAKWDIITYTITYNLNGGTQSGNALTEYTVLTDDFTLINPTKDYYTFVGWTGSNGNTPEDSVTITKGSIGNKTYNANYVATDYTITYNLNGGIEGEDTIHSYNVETNTFDLVAPSMVGYTFGGWYDNSELNGESYESIEQGSYGNREFYAKWNIITYTVTYNLNGGIHGENVINNYTVESETFDLVSPSKVGYTFVGWYDNSELNGESYESIEQGSHGNREFYAKWDIITYTITYNLNGGTEGEGTPHNYTIESETFPLVEPTRGGYTFVGWYLDSEFTGTTITSIETNSYGNREYYAKWEAIEYTITYHLNEGTLTDLIKTEYTADDATFSLAVPRKDNNNFLGWYLDSEFTSDVQTKIVTGSYGNKDYYAKWEAYRDYTGYNVSDVIRDGAPLDNTSSLFVTDSDGIDFSLDASLMNGYGKYKASETVNNTNPIYYYRGNVDNNNIAFGGFCWKMVRTTETGGTKLIYNGIYENGRCDKTGTATQIANKVKYTTAANKYEYIGYAYNTTHGFGSRAAGKTNNGTFFGNDVIYEDGVYKLVDTYVKDDDFSDNIDSILTTHHYTCFTTSDTCSTIYYVYLEKSGTMLYLILSGGDTIDSVLNNGSFNKDTLTSSTVKTKVDTWYSSNMTSYTSLLEDTVFCNDRTPLIKGGWDKNGSPEEKIAFGATVRSETLGTPSYACANVKDRFTVSTDNGNGGLTYPVGLLSADEAVYAGFAWWQEDTFTYLDNGHIWWTMSPSRISANTIYIDVVYSMLDNVSATYVSSSSITAGGVRPVISLNANAVIASGKGTVSEPFIIE